jgi:hypothetical protein
MEQPEEARSAKKTKDKTLSSGKSRSGERRKKKDKKEAEKVTKKKKVDAEKQKKKHVTEKKAKKRKRTRSSSSSEPASSSSGSSSDSSGSDSESSEVSSDSSSQTKAKRRKRSKNKAADKDSDEQSSSDESSRSRKKKSGKSKLDWDLMDKLWPIEDRPTELQSRKVASKYGMDKMLKMKANFVKEMEKKGLGVAVFSKDRKPKTKKFKKMADDGDKKLHEARFEGLPRSEPAAYWGKVPVNRQEIYRHLPLKHLGVDGVPEAAIVKVHNRMVPVELASFYKDMTEIVHVQMAVFNYIAVLRSLHPYDYGGLALQAVLIEAGWGVHLSADKKETIRLIKKFFDESLMENSGRAVRKEVPLSYEEVRISHYLLT